MVPPAPPIKRTRSGGPAPVHSAVTPLSRGNSQLPPPSRPPASQQPPSSSSSQHSLSATTATIKPVKEVSALSSSQVNIRFNSSVIQNKNAVSARVVPSQSVGGASGFKRTQPPQKLQTNAKPEPSPLEVQLTTKCAEIQTQCELAEALLTTLTNICTVHGPDAIEQMVDEHAQQREDLRNAPDPLDTVTTPARIADDEECLLQSITAEQQHREKLCADVDRTHEEIILAREELEDSKNAYAALMAPLEAVTARKEEWDESLRQLRAELALERDSTYGLSAEAAALLKESERLLRHKKELEKQAAATEMERRAAHSTYEELKGTIRVYCRVKGSGAVVVPLPSPPSQPQPQLSSSFVMDVNASLTLSTADDTTWSMAESIMAARDGEGSTKPTAARLSTDSCASHDSARSSCSVTAGGASNSRPRGGTFFFNV
ncbi:Hypothetical protein, putative [Bodo saltans]|uniref:Uncharacterized protein n=1 Tax=Bodo saltans TaxID=75058 RepID=A0A0S4KHV7_BODSA|nr:Hypothetical protein, putative [Bodo saltans]|eukprot:CUI14708.1 Hypothetical protein, putative [Bodo saltans]